MGFSAAVTAAVLAPTIYQAVDANQQRQQAKGAMNAEKDRMAKAEMDLKDKQAQADADAAAAVTRGQARKKQRMNAASAGGRQSTILTSPLGIQGGQEGAQKTLLGS